MALIKDKMVQSISASKIIETDDKKFLTSSNAIDSDSQETVATSLAVKLAYDKAEQAFQSASNGKRLIAEAIIGKGGTASESDSFQMMSDSIKKINIGGTKITNTNKKNGVFIEEVTAGDTVKSVMVEEVRHIYKATNVIDIDNINYKYDSWGYVSEDNTVGSEGYYTEIFTL